MAPQKSAEITPFFRSITLRALKRKSGIITAINTLTTVTTGSECLHLVLTTASIGHLSVPRIILVNIVYSCILVE